MAKGYFVKEKTAPEGYEKDENAYYFAITKDGQTVVIENGEAGRGFVNEAYRGNLKIVKDSSDGRKDGFAFEVKSADGAYCETFTTPDTGIIEIQGLRIGVYTVTEVENRASMGYIIPDGATVEIKTGETATVQFFNEKPEEDTPDTSTPEKPSTPTTPTTPANPSTPTTPSKTVPQTGDDYGMYLWIGVLALAVIGSGVSLALYVCRKKNSRKSSGQQKAMAAVLLVFVALAAGSGIMLAQEIGQYKAGSDAYAGLMEFVEAPAQPEEETSIKDAEDAPEDDAGVPSVILPTIDFAALQEQGQDVVAWLQLPDTAINYPVAHTDDNDYYLKHLYDGTANKYGCLFIDYENQADFSDKSTIIYGHNMRDGSMFSTLGSYAEQSYYDEHPVMYLMTPDAGYVVELFTAFVASPGEIGGGTSPWALEWKDDGAFTTWLTAMRERSVIETDVSVTSSDHILTLSTCTNGGRDRFIVMGKLVEVTDN